MRVFKYYISMLGGQARRVYTAYWSIRVVQVVTRHRWGCPTPPPTTTIRRPATPSTRTKGKKECRKPKSCYVITFVCLDRCIAQRLSLKKHKFTGTIILK